MNIQLKRAYEPATAADGKRVLVDKLWPRGIKKENAQIDEWLKEVAPSTELRKWFNHQVEKWPEFQQRYQQELQGNSALEQLRAWAQDCSKLTLVFAAKDELHNNAVVLKQLLQNT